MTHFPDLLNVGSNDDTTTYQLAPNHYLVEVSTTSFSATDEFEDLLPIDLPKYIEAARSTLEPAGLRWIEVADHVAVADAEARFEETADVGIIRPVYFANGEGADSAATPIYDTITVELSDDVAGPRMSIEALGLVFDPVRSELLQPFQVYLTPEGTNLEQAMVLLRQVDELDGVHSAEFDWLKLETVASAPNDPLFGNQWGARAIKLSDALDLTSGDPSITIAVIDTGFDLEHPDIAYTPAGTHFNGDEAMSGMPPPYDASSVGRNHGTAVAGIAAARTDNGVGIAGIGAGCRVMPVGWGRRPTSNGIVAGVNWAANNGANVACMSFRTVETRAANTAMTNAWRAGMVLCAATGNSGRDTTSPAVSFPARHTNVIAVGASDQNGQRKRPESADGECWGSQFDATTDVVAPGVRIWTTDEQGTRGYNDNGGGATREACVDYASSGDTAGEYYSVFNGTSSATPHVAGLAGLMFSAKPNATNEQVRDAIEASCDKISEDRYRYARTPGRLNGTWHQEVGYGQINAYRALVRLLGRSRPIDFREGWIDFGKSNGRRQRGSTTVTFQRPVASQQALLKGFNIRYSNGDRRVLETELDLDTTSNGTDVTVSGDFVLRDSSGNYDDPYEGWINFIVMAELA